MGEKKIIILFLVAAVLLGIIFIPGYLNLKRLSRENQDLEKQMEQVRQENQRLAVQQQRLTNDPFYVEKVAREKLGVAKKGEVVYRVPAQQPEQ
ncbi:septum formation initiator family protein [Candidatus Omnitrophota bacterium]